jgi:hypothetical protein
MAVTTAGVVLAARPADRVADSTPTRLASATMAQPASAQRNTRTIDVPENLSGHRLKIRMAPELGARLLPDGQLLSLKGRDLTELSGLIRTLGARLTPAVKATESDINRIRLKAAANGGGTKSDIAATFWVDGDEDTDLDHIARKLNRLSEVEMVVFSRSTIRPEPHFVQHTPQRRLPRLTPKPIPMLGPFTGDTDTTRSNPVTPIVRQSEHVTPLEEALRQLEQRRLESSDAHLAELRAASRERRESGDDRLLPAGGVCCYSILNTNITGPAGGPEVFGAGFDHFCAKVATDDDCEVLAGPGASHFAFITDATDCAVCEPERFGACCTEFVLPILGVKTRDGDNDTQGGCYDPPAPSQWGDDDPEINPNFPLGNSATGVLGGPSYGANREYFGNCESCRLVYGMCELNEGAIGVAGLDDNYFAIPPIGDTSGSKFRVCDLFNPDNRPLDVPVEAFGYPSPVQNWTWLTNPPFPASAAIQDPNTGPPQDSTGDQYWNWVQPRLELDGDIDASNTLQVYTGNRTPNGNFLRIGEDLNQGDPPNHRGWQGFGVPRQMSNPAVQRVIGSARLVANSFDESASDRCETMEGTWIPSRTLGRGVVFEWRTNLNISTPPQPTQYPLLFYKGTLLCGDPLGSCTATTGETTITQLSTCQAAAIPLNYDYRMLWAPSIIDPSMLIQGPSGGYYHALHNNWMRPTWSVWFTPPSNSNFDENGTFDQWETWCPPRNPFNTLTDFMDPLCVPGKLTANAREFIVPPWEYIGSNVEWTGWDPERWWNDGVDFAPLLNSAQFLEAFPDITSTPFDEGGANQTDIYAAPTSGRFPEIQNPGHYGPICKFGIPPTGSEFENVYGWANQRGDPLTWANPDDPTDSWWPTYPRFLGYAYHWQIEGSNSGLVPQQRLYPFDFGWQRWTDDTKMFDIDQSIEVPPGQADPTFQLGGRYLNRGPLGLTRWEYQGDQEPLPFGTPSEEMYYPFRYFTGTGDHPLSGEPTRGSCFFPHSETFPTIPGTDNNEAYPGEEEAYIGNYCDDADCCDYVATRIARCCTASTGAQWDALCVQIAIDQYLVDRASATPFLSYTCSGITPYIVPEYPTYDPTNPPTYYFPAGEPIADKITGLGTYNSDPVNIALNPYLSGLVENGRTPGNLPLRVGVLPRFVDPTYGQPDHCVVADQSASNSLWPPPRMVAPSDSSSLSPEFLEYAEQRDRAARLYQFMPRCQGIYSSAGQCNVPGTKSGRSSWDQVAEDEDILIGCQDFDCCMRVMSRMLDEKDAADPTHQLSDFEWMPKQWTPKMAMVARELCYPSVQKVNLEPMHGGDPNLAPDFFSLQINAMAEAHQVVTNNSGIMTDEWIAGPSLTSTSGMHNVSADQALRQLIWAPFSWSDPTLDDGAMCMPAHQNMYEMCPEPYYGADGLGIWPDIDFNNDPLAQVQNAFTSFTSGVSYLSEVQPSADLNAFGRGVKIAVLAESAWLQEYTLFGEQRGAIHPDLVDNVTLEPGVTLDFTDERATARGTAVLGVIAASNNGYGVTGLAYEAETWFFPTRGTGTPGTGSQERIEDAFFAAMSVLDPGDIMVLAFEPNGNTIINDLRIQPFLEIAASLGVSIIIPAGDVQADVGDPPDIAGIENITVVGATTPGKDANYLRWWSSNYSEINTVDGFIPGLPNICAWGGGVVTTGGNANLTLLSVEDVATVDPDTGEYTLKPLGKKWSYTNDFGANLDGTVAAAAQIAAATACVQGFSRDWFGHSLLPAVLQARMWGTALTGNSIDVPAGITGNGPANAGGTFTWDLDQVNADTPRSVGRMPQMGRLLQNLYEDGPNEGDFGDDERPSSLISLQVITGRLIEGNWFNVTVAGEDEWVSLQGVRAGPGYVEPVIGQPGDVYYPWRHNITDIMLTFEISPEAVIGADFGVNSIRSGLQIDGSYTVALYDFQRRFWRDLQPEELPTDAPDYLAIRFPTAPPGIGRFLELQPSGNYRLYCRIVTRTPEYGDYIWYLDFVELQSLFNPRP